MGEGEVVEHALDPASVVNPCTGQPWPRWAGTEPQDPDPRCLCGASWSDEDGGCQLNEEERLRAMRTIAVDFDGVIHQYGKGWHDGKIYDGLMPGAHEGIDRLFASGYAVYVFTSRHVEPVVAWMREQGFDVVDEETLGYQPEFWDSPTQILVTNRKLAAAAYLDDRAVRFDSWPVALSTLSAMRMRGEL